MGYRKAGRPPKHIGLGSPLEKVSDGTELRDLRNEEPKPEGPVLQEAPKDGASQARKGRIFGAVDGDNRGRNSEALAPAVLDPPGRPASDDVDVTFTQFLKKVAVELADARHQTHDTKMMNLEVLARLSWEEALSRNFGSQRVREMIIERLEGKAVKGEKPPVPDTTVEEQIERSEVELINALTIKEK